MKARMDAETLHEFRGDLHTMYGVIELIKGKIQETEFGILKRTADRIAERIEKQ